jgi:hypothetical protein
VRTARYPRPGAALLPAAARDCAAATHSVTERRAAARSRRDAANPTLMAVYAAETLVLTALFALVGTNTQARLERMR